MSQHRHARSSLHFFLHFRLPSPLSGLQAISTMSSLSVHNGEQVDQHWTEGAMNIIDGNDDDGNDVISNQFFDY